MIPAFPSDDIFHPQMASNLLHAIALTKKFHFPEAADEHKKLGLMPMLINPILENAIKHGNLYKEDAYIKLVEVQEL